jgi:hypothetical protein
MQTALTLDDQEVLFVVLEKEFALSHLALSLVNKDTARSVPVTTMRDLNRQFIHEVLPGGNYTLALTQAWTGAALQPSLRHCEVLSLHVQLRSNWQGSPLHIADCSSYDLLPWDLSGSAGGSVPYGGPMNPTTGEVAVYGDHFLYPEVSSTADGYAFVQFSTESKASMHVLVYFKLNGYSTNWFVQDEQGESDSSFSLLGWDEAGGTFVAPSYSMQTSHGFRLELFQLQEATGGMVQLGFSEVPQGLGTCPYYTFALYSESSPALADMLLCTAQQQAAFKVRPTSSPVLNATTNTFYEHVTGALSTAGPMVASLGPIKVSYLPSLFVLTVVDCFSAP